MGYTGRCLCGAVTLRIDGSPVGEAQCWCRQCQTSAGGGPANNAIFMSDIVTIEGPLATTGWHAASGTNPTLDFCPTCGTHICGRSPSGPGMMAVRIGVIDQPHDLMPHIAIWTEEAPTWAVIDPALPSMAQQPSGLEEQQ